MRVFPSFVAVASFLALGALALPVRADDGEKRDLVREQHYEDRLGAIDPSLVPTFHTATTALDGRDLPTAKTGFATVIAKAPTFDPALRRLCVVESLLGENASAITHCRAAVAVERSPENESALATALISQKMPSSAQEHEAMSLAREAALAKPDEAYLQATLCEVAIREQDAATADGCSTKLLAIQPNQYVSHLYRAFALGMTGNLTGGEKELDRAHALGLSDEQYRALRSQFHAARPLYQRVFFVLGPIFGIWLALLGLLFATGRVLSNLTLREIQRAPADAKTDSTPAERRLRRFYRWIVTVTALYFYASIPLVAIAVVGFAGALILAFLAIGHVPIKLLFISGLVVIYTLLAIYRSLTTRVTDRDPGTKLDLGTEPRLAAVLAETAASVGTRPVDAVYLVADTRVAVTERGGFVKQLRGQGERALILGVGALDGLTVRPLKAVLAHEYGHFRNEDTAGGGVALAARRSLQLMALHMAMRGVATWYNPAWWFVRGYDAAYLRISQGASRLQEVLADRWAVLGYGADAFVTGLRHVVTRSIAFDHHLDVSIKEAIEDKSAIANLYTHTPKAAPSNESLAKEVDEEWNKKPSPYDSHPRGADREAWARAFGATGASLAADDAEPAWSLFHDRAALERAMTDEVRGAIAKRHGITIAAE